MKKILMLCLFASLLATLIYFTVHNMSSRQSTLAFSDFKKENSCLALNYHRVREKTLYNQMIKLTSNNNELKKYSVFKEEFKHQLIWMKEHGADFLTEQEFLRAYQTRNFPKGCVYISFDDADITTYTNALPILKELHIPATVFIIAGHVGDKNFNNIRLADWQQLKEMKESGVFNFGSHTYDMHEVVNDQPVFDSVPNKAFIKDLKKSKKEIKKHLGVDVQSFAYPYGETNDRIAAAVKKAGFKHAYILAPMPVNHNTSDYYINRIMIDDEVFNHYIKKWPGFTE